MTVGHLLHKVPEYPLPRVSVSEHRKRRGAPAIPGVALTGRISQGAHSLSFKAHTAKTMPFISKLRALLSEAENADCIAWEFVESSFLRAWCDGADSNHI